MSILDWLDTYRMAYESKEPYVNMLLSMGLHDDPMVQEYRDYKRGYELLQIEYQSTSAMN